MIRNGYFFESAGHEFEDELIGTISSFSKKTWGPKAVRFSTLDQDRFEGTDLYVLDVPVDVTLHFEGKNRTKALQTQIIDGVTVSWGVRFGNGKATFKTPVLVIGAETAVGISKSNMWIALEIIKANIANILDKGMDLYFDATA